VLKSNAISTAEMGDKVHSPKQVGRMGSTETQSEARAPKDTRDIMTDTNVSMAGDYDYPSVVSQQRDLEEEVQGNSAGTIESIQTDDQELAEGYSRLADEMADYICWDMSSGLPSWIDFDATSADL
jgi:hypothetical protein